METLLRNDTLSSAGFDRLVLGSVDESVGFYLACGFQPLLYIECAGVDRAQVRDRILAERLSGREVVGSWDEEEFSKAVVWVDQPDHVFRRALDDEYGCGTQYLMVRMLNKQSPARSG